MKKQFYQMLVVRDKYSRTKRNRCLVNELIKGTKLTRYLKNM
jgi:hypothetical protein